MPKLNYSFSVELKEDFTRPYGTTVYIADPKIFTKIEILNFRLVSDEEKWGRKIQIECAEGDPRLEVVLSHLAELGFEPSPNEFFTERESGRQIRLGARRTYSKGEIAAAQILSLGIPDPYVQIAEWDMSASRKGPLTIEVDSLQGLEIEIGMVDCVETYLVTESMMLSIIDAGMMGAEFREVAYNRPEEVTKRLWKFVPGQEMPFCRTKRIDAWTGGEIVPEKTQTIVWRSDAYPREIHFSREEVESIGHFDIAFTREVVGNFPDRYRPDIIVSQRFREFLEDRNVRWVPYIPVRIED